MKRWGFAAWLAAMLCAAALCAASAQEACPDGVYRGFYYAQGVDQVAVQFEIKDGLFKSVVLRSLKNETTDYLARYTGWDEWQIRRSFGALAHYLIGKDTQAVADLYNPAAILADVDIESSATVPYHYLVSAVYDGLNRRPYKLVDTSKLPEAAPYADGRYRGWYAEEDHAQIIVEFTLADGCITQIGYEMLEHLGVDYLAEDASEEAVLLRGQFQALIDYLQGKPVSSVNDLYQPGKIVPDTDVSSGATIRSPKVIAAIWNGLNQDTWRID